MKLSSALAVLTALCSTTAVGRSDPQASAAEPAQASPAEPAQASPANAARASAPRAKAAYSPPWQLRPAAAARVVRSDTTIAFHEAPSGDAGTTVASMLLYAHPVTDEIAPLVRLGLLSSSPPGDAVDDALVLVNPAIGATWARPLGRDLRVAVFLGVTLPLGMGGGNDAEPAEAVAAGAGVPARSAMDNAMFAVNDLTVFPGVGLAWVASGFTVQGEVTVLQLTRVRGDEVQKDSSKTNLTSGFHVGYFVVPALSLGAELRHQRWLSTPSFVEADDTRRDTTTWAAGARVHVELSKGTWLRPGLAYARPLDDPMKAAKYQIVQVDVPLAF